MPELRSPLTAQIVEWRVRPGDLCEAVQLVEQRGVDRARVARSVIAQEPIDRAQGGRDVFAFGAEGDLH